LSDLLLFFWYCPQKVYCFRGMWLWLSYLLKVLQMDEHNWYKITDLLYLSRYFRRVNVNLHLHLIKPLENKISHIKVLIFVKYSFPNVLVIKNLLKKKREKSSSNKQKSQIIIKWLFQNHFYHPFLHSLFLNNKSWV